MKAVAVVFVVLAIFGLKERKKKPKEAYYERYEYKNLQSVREEESFNKILKFIIMINKTISKGEAEIIAEYIMHYSGQYDVSPILITALIGLESVFRKDAVSRSGALGLGQLMPITIKELGIELPFDIKENIHGTVKYLKSRIDFWENRSDKIELALASYKLGLEIVKKHQSVPPEAIEYINKINEHIRTILNL